MNRRRDAKKSETLEVRVAHEVKTALMQKARAEGRSASDVVRESIGSYLAASPKEARTMIQTLWKPAAAIGTASIAFIWAAIAPTPVHAKPDLRAVYQAIDRNGDGALTADEFRQHPSNPEIRKLHEAHKGGMHDRMVAMHGKSAQAPHGPPTDETILAHFSKIDANSDSKLSFEEFRAFHDDMTALHAAH